MEPRQWTLTETETKMVMVSMSGNEKEMEAVAVILYEKPLPRLQQHHGQGNGYRRTEGMVSCASEKPWDLPMKLLVAIFTSNVCTRTFKYVAQTSSLAVTILRPSSHPKPD